MTTDHQLHRDPVDDYADDQLVVIEALKLTENGYTLTSAELAGASRPNDWITWTAGLDPELIVVGLNPETAAKLIGHWNVSGEDPYADRERNGITIYALRLDPAWVAESMAFTSMVRRQAGLAGHFDAVQLAPMDPQQRTPGTDGYDYRWTLLPGLEAS